MFLNPFEGLLLTATLINAKTPNIISKAPEIMLNAPAKQPIAIASVFAPTALVTEAIVIIPSTASKTPTAANTHEAIKLSTFFPFLYIIIHAFY